MVVWLDVLSAKARYGEYISGVVPEFVPWERVFHARSSASKRRLRGSGAATASADGGAAAEEEEEEGDEGGGGGGASKYAVNLRRVLRAAASASAP